MRKVWKLFVKVLKAVYIYVSKEETSYLYNTLEEKLYQERIGDNPLKKITCTNSYFDPQYLETVIEDHGCLVLYTTVTNGIVKSYCEVGDCIVMIEKHPTIPFLYKGQRYSLADEIEILERIIDESTPYKTLERYGEILGCYNVSGFSIVGSDSSVDDLYEDFKMYKRVPSTAEDLKELLGLVKKEGEVPSSTSA